MEKHLTNLDITKIKELDIRKIILQCLPNCLKKWERQVQLAYVKTTGKWTETKRKIDLEQMVSWIKEYMKRERDQILLKLNQSALSELQCQAWCIQLRGCTTKLVKNIHFIRDHLRKKLKWPKQWVLFNGAAPALGVQWCLLHQLDQNTASSTMMETKNTFCSNKSRKIGTAWAICLNKFKERNKSSKLSEEQFPNTKESWFPNKLQKKIYLPLSKKQIIWKEKWASINKLSTWWTRAIRK